MPRHYQQTPEEKEGKANGRPQYLSTKRSRRLSADLIKIGKSPLDIMIGNMLFWHDQVARLTEQFGEIVVDIEDPDDKKEAMQLLKQLLVCRENAQRCAVDAAPFCHPKYHSIQYQKDSEDAEGVQMPANQVEASAMYARLITSGA